jgi:hypothetical protein
MHTKSNKDISVTNNIHQLMTKKHTAILTQNEHQLLASNISTLFPVLAANMCHP